MRRCTASSSANRASTTITSQRSSTSSCRSGSRSCRQRSAHRRRARRACSRGRRGGLGDDHELARGAAGMRAGSRRARRAGSRGGRPPRLVQRRRRCRRAAAPRAPAKHRCRCAADRCRWDHDADDARRVCEAGATAIQSGTAFLLCPEAGTSEAHRRAVGAGGTTALTRAFTGRLARGISNEFMRAHPAAPRAYPQVHHLTAPLRAAARAAGDAHRIDLWAGTGFSRARALPASEVVARLCP